MKETGPRLLAADLDGTLLTSDKRITDRTVKVLNLLTERYGTVIIPATGRMLASVPDKILQLEGARYVITENGAQIIDLPEKRPVYQCGIPFAYAAELIGFLDRLPVLYDCYAEDGAYMPEQAFAEADRYVLNDSLLQKIHSDWIVVKDLKERILASGKDIMKIQCYIKPESLQERKRIREEIADRFPDIRISSTASFHLEIGNRNTGKGKAFRILSELLDIPAEATMAFGDGDNDRDLLETAGTGIAMLDSGDAVKNAADGVTAFSSDFDGVADYLERHILL